MGFEPLGTDEKLAHKPEGQKEFEAQMMGGCMVIGLGSVVIAALASWPWFIIESHRIAGLQFWLAAGALPALAGGAIMCRAFGLAGGSGFVGGSLVASCFFFLRMDQGMLRNLIPDVPKPDYPEAWKYLVPLVWLIVSLVVAGLFISPKEFSTENRDAKSQ